MCVVGIFEASAGSLFASAHLVFIPYCSSDAHLGTNTAYDLDFGDDDGVRTIYFNGQSLARTIVQVGEIEAVVLFDVVYD